MCVSVNKVLQERGLGPAKRPQRDLVWDSSRKREEDAAVSVGTGGFRVAWAGGGQRPWHASGHGCAFMSLHQVWRWRIQVEFRGGRSLGEFLRD